MKEIIIRLELCPFEIIDNGGGIVKVLQKIGDHSWDVLHMGVVNENCYHKLEELVGEYKKELEKSDIEKELEKLKVFQSFVKS